MRTFRLATIGAMLAVTATAIAMGGYALFQYSQHPGSSQLALLGEHALHVALLATPIWVALALGFNALLFRPIRKLESALYRVATGHPGPVQLDTRVAELCAIERAANLMVQRMALGTERTGSRRVDEQLADLRLIADELEALAPAAAARIRQRSASLNLTVTALAQIRASDPPLLPPDEQGADAVFNEVKSE